MTPPLAPTEEASKILVTGRAAYASQDLVRLVKAGEYQSYYARNCDHRARDLDEMTTS
ncbi:MAG: hypothetical protein LAP38_02270 [Acidobacteriia bacterium]|nr:hypothetical protein [Terriglobia bacterium]